MEETRTSKRIASNTLILLCRMLILTVINLYAVRLLLNNLGIIDYGIFNTISGVITTSIFITGVMSLSIQRFFSIALTNNDKDLINKIFSSSLNIITIISIILFVSFETLGVWFLETKLISADAKIPLERSFATHVLFHTSLLSFIISLFQIPFTACIFAHEKMKIYSTISTIDGLLRLAAAFLIAYIHADNLIFYGASLASISVIIFALYIAYFRKSFRDIKYTNIKEPDLYKSILSFSSWTLFGSLASMGIIQGNTTLLGMFYGPVIVASFGISIQINNAFNSLCNSMVLAFRPQMIQAYKKHDDTYLIRLFGISNKLLAFMLAAIAIPLIFRMDFVINIWLGNTPEQMILFSQLIIIYTVLMALHHPITTIVQASGKLKQYHLPVESMTLLCMPLTYILFKLGYPPQFVFFSMIGICLATLFVRIICLSHIYNKISVRDYIIHFQIPSLFVISASCLATYFINSIFNNDFAGFIAVCLSNIIIMSLLIWSIALSKEEKTNILHYLKKAANKIAKNKV